MQYENIDIVFHFNHLSLIKKIGFELDAVAIMWFIIGFFLILAIKKLKFDNKITDLTCY